MAAQVLVNEGAGLAVATLNYSDDTPENNGWVNDCPDVQEVNAIYANDVVPLNADYGAISSWPYYSITDRLPSTPQPDWPLLP